MIYYTQGDGEHSAFKPMGTDIKFVNELKKYVIEKTLSDYVEMLKSTNLSDVGDLKWKTFLTWVQEKPERIDAIEVAFRQVITDALAATLGAIDGSYLLDEFRGDISLMYEGKQINGELLNLLREHEG